MCNFGKCEVHINKKIDYTKLLNPISKLSNELKEKQRTNNEKKKIVNCEEQFNKSIYILINHKTF